MTTVSTDPRDIEAELERDRAELASTLDQLSDRVSVDSLARDALATVKSYAGSYTSTVDHAVRANPLAVALIGAGVAWLAFGGRFGGRGSEPRRTTFMGHPEHDELPRWESEGGPPPEPGVAYRPTTSGGDDHSWSDSIRDLRARATAALARIERDAAAAVGSVRDSLSSTLSGAGGAAKDYAGAARDFAAERAQVVSTFTADLRDRLAQGLDALPAPARERVIAAREKAYAASLQAERVGRQAVSDPAKAMEEHPLVAGAVAFALGAAVAAMLPRTEAEDRAFGSERDRLMDEAGRVLRAERERALQIAGSVGQEIKAAATEAAGSIADTAKAKASEIADTAKAKAGEIAGRVQERATDEVNRLADESAPKGPSPVLG